jgi:hypothetical protein
MRRPLDACGIPAEYADTVTQFRAVTDDMKNLAFRGGQVAVLDSTVDYYVGAGIAPWGRYLPLLVNLFKQDQVTATEEQLLAERPEWVLIRTDSEAQGYVHDAWVQLHGVVERTYGFDHRVGPFEVWHLTPGGP